MKKVIFIEMDPYSVQIASRVFLQKQEEIRVIFCSNAEQALTLMSKDTFDIIITEFQLPGLSGTDFLNLVKRYYPKTVRVVISNQASVETIVHTADLVHQFLPKPLQQESLESCLRRALSFSNLLGDIKIQQLLLGIKSLPSLPALYLEIIQELQGPDPSADRVGEIITRDMSMSAKVLQLVNSAYFGLPRFIANASQATVILGVETIRDLVFIIQVFSQFDTNKLRRLGLTSLWDHSLSVGFISKTIARSINSDKEWCDLAFLSGMLHDLGKLLFVENFTMKYFSTLGAANRKAVPLHIAEKEIFGLTHAELGAYLLGIWGLPDMVVDSTLYHHQLNLVPEGKLSLAPVIHLADVFDHQINSERMKVPYSDFDMVNLTRLGISKEQIDRFRQRIAR